MAKFKIVHEEKLKGYYFVEAKDERNAIDVFEEKCNRGEIDFSDLDLIDSSDTAYFVSEEE